MMRIDKGAARHSVLALVTLLLLAVMTWIPRAAAAVQLENWVYQGTITNVWAEGLVFDPAGNLYIADCKSKSILKVAPGGGTTTFVNVGLSLEGLAIDQSGNIYAAVVDTSGPLVSTWVEKYDSAGNRLGAPWLAPYADAGTNANWRNGVAVDSFGNVYVSDFIRNTITKYAANGAILPVSFSGPIAYPYGLAVDAANNLYVANMGGNNILKFNTATGALIALSPMGYGSAVGQLTAPEGVTVEKVPGYIWVTESGPLVGNNRFQKFDSSWNLLASVGGPAPGSAHGQFIDPDFIAPDNTGRKVYVTDRNNDRIEIFVLQDGGGTRVPVLTGWWLLPGILAGLGLCIRRRS